MKQILLSSPKSFCFGQKGGRNHRPEGTGTGLALAQAASRELWAGGAHPLKQRQRPRARFQQVHTQQQSPGESGRTRLSLHGLSNYPKTNVFAAQGGTAPRATPVLFSTGHCGKAVFLGNQLPCFGSGCPVSFQTRLPVLLRADDEAPRVCPHSLFGPWPWCC